MFIAYPLLTGHPAAEVLKNTLRKQTGWFILPMDQAAGSRIALSVLSFYPPGARRCSRAEGHARG